MKICVLVYDNNSEFATENIESVLKQTYTEFDLFVCTNNDQIKNRFSKNNINWININAPKHIVLRKYFDQILAKQYDWIWYLDSNFVADTNALKELMCDIHASEMVGFFTSVIKHNEQVVYTPKICTTTTAKGEPKWSDIITESKIRVSSAFFASVLININAIRKIGYPNDEQLEDFSEYLSIISEKYGAGYYVTKSVCFEKSEKKDFLIANSRNKICAVVVTYNRKYLLKECIEALCAQSYKLFDIFIIDNASTDGTKEYIAPTLNDKIKYFNTGSNLGGAGGFYYGMKLAYEEGYNWIWIMDDDVIPNTTALQELVEPTKEIKNASFFASAVYSPKGEAMNTPEISKFSTNGYRFWYAHLDKGLVRLAHATFVSLLINRNAIAKCGLPCKDYFIWGDDTEYTMRIIGKYGAAYMVGKSKVVHKREISSSLSIYNENNPKRIKMYYYLIRNTLLNAKTYFGKVSFNNFKRNYLKDAIKIALGKRGYRLLKVKTILKAIYDFDHANYDKRAFENRYSLYGQERLVATITCKTCPELKPFCTIRTIESSMFGYNKYVDSYVLSFLKQDASSNSKVDVNNLEPLDTNEKLVLDIDSLVRPLIVIKHDNQTYFFDETVSFSDNIFSAEDINVNYVNPHDLNRKDFIDRIYCYIDEILQHYKQRNIIVIKPKDINNNDIFEYVSKKIPNSKFVASIEELYSEKIEYGNNNNNM